MIAVDQEQELSFLSSRHTFVIVSLLWGILWVITGQLPKQHCYQYPIMLMTYDLDTLL